METLLAIMPIVIPTNNNSGNITPVSAEGFIALLIVINIITLLIFGIRSLIWLSSKNKRNVYTFFKYTIWSNADILTTDLNTAIFIAFNGIALITYLTAFVTTLL